MGEFTTAEPYDYGMLDTGDGNRIYWETRGNPDGKPALLVHGGPGAGSPKGTPKVFDPERYRVILFDQRGCGRSTPHASDPATDMSLNTSEHLLRDMEQLREHLGVERWLLWGGSWGSGLSVAYAERHPSRVFALILVAFWLMGRSEVDWLYRSQGAARIFPEAWQDFRDGAPGDQDVVTAYAELLDSYDLAVRQKAAGDWSAWEDKVLSLESAGKPAPYSDRPDDGLVAFARICSRYAANNGYFPDGALMRDAPRLNGIPGVIVHGRRDLSCLPGVAWEFSRRWSTGELFVVEEAGHKGGGDFGARMGAAIERFASS